MSRLIVISNRVADLEKGAQSGGLAVALGDALKAKKGLWFGWDGNILADGARLATNVREQGGVTFATSTTWAFPTTCSGRLFTTASTSPISRRPSCRAIAASTSAWRRRWHR